MLPMAVCVESWGGLAGGEAKSAACKRVSGGGCDESQDSADGSNILFLFLGSSEIYPPTIILQVLSAGSRGIEWMAYSGIAWVR
jgi:hypothetical protein